MPSSSEKGRAKTLGNFKLLQAAAASLQPKYNPANARLSPGNLLLLHQGTKAVLAALNDAEGPYKRITQRRRVNFAPISKLLTRLKGALKAADIEKAAKAEAVKNLESLIRKYRGVAAPGTAENEKADATPNGTGPEDLMSVTQTSLEEKANTFNRIIVLLSENAGYNPNEADLTITSLKALLTTLQTDNEEAGDAITAYRTARLALVAAFDTPDSGMIDLAQTAKEYIKSTFGAHSPEYKGISGLKFEHERKK